MRSRRPRRTSSGWARWKPSIGTSTARSPSPPRPSRRASTCRRRAGPRCRGRRARRASASSQRAGEHRVEVVVDHHAAGDGVTHPALLSPPMRPFLIALLALAVLAPSAAAQHTQHPPKLPNSTKGAKKCKTVSRGELLVPRLRHQGQGAHLVQEGAQDRRQAALRREGLPVLRLDQGRQRPLVRRLLPLRPQGGHRGDHARHVAGRYCTRPSISLTRYLRSVSTPSLMTGRSKTGIAVMRSWTHSPTVATAMRRSVSPLGSSSLPVSTAV